MRLVSISEKPLVFVQNAAGDSFTVYQDGKEVRGIRSIRIDAGVDEFTTHEIEYLTGATIPKEDELKTTFTEEHVKALKYAMTNPTPTKKPATNELRKEAIEKAKKFVEVTETKAQSMESNYVGNYTFREDETKPEYVVNEDKRTVVVLTHGKYSGKIESKGIAKCAPSDVFNVHIGKAIALGRAYGLNVSEFEQAPQPGEVVVGMVVNRFNRYGKNLGLSRVKSSRELIRGEQRHSPDSTHEINGCLLYGGNHGDRIISDTEAQY